MPENTLNRLFSVAATKFRTLVTVKRRDGIVAAFKASCSALSRLLSYRWNRVTRAGCRDEISQLRGGFPRFGTQFGRLLRRRVGVFL